MVERIEHAWSARAERVRRLFGRHLTRHAGPERRSAGADGFAVHCVRDGERHILAPRGQLDLASAWQLDRELRRAEATDAREILVDLGGLEFIDSAGMEVVIHASARTPFHRKRLMIMRAPQPVHRTFELSGVAARLPFVERRAGVPLP